MLKQISCYLCPKTFARRGRMFNQKQTHNVVKYNCPQCKRSFSHNHQLKKCTVGRNCTSAYNATNHLAKTIVWRPNRSFTVGGNRTGALSVTSHLAETIDSLDHSGEEPNKCTQCNYSCDTSNVKRHIKKHTGENLHQCNQCEYKRQNRATCKSTRRHILVKSFTDVWLLCGYSCISIKIFRCNNIRRKEEMIKNCNNDMLNLWKTECSQRLNEAPHWNKSYNCY